MYTIKQAAARSGLSVPTLRAWERRYGVIQPRRTPAGYRLYDDTAIDRLLAMRFLIEHEGLRPSQAADQVVAAGAVPADLADLVTRAAAADRAVAERAAAEGTAAADLAPPGAPAAPPPPVTGGHREATIADLVSAACRLDVAGMERFLDEAFAAERFEAALEHVVFPALRAIGDGWADGSIDVAMEHAASETVRRRLGRFYDAVAPTGTADVVVGLPPGSHHEIGALAFAVAARRRGLDVVYLGADVPLASWRTAIETARAPVAVVGVATEADVMAARDVVGALRPTSGSPAVAVGGPAGEQLAGLDGSVVLPSSIDDAVSMVLRSLDGSHR